MLQCGKLAVQLPVFYTARGLFHGFANSPLGNVPDHQEKRMQPRDTCLIPVLSSETECMYRRSANGTLGGESVDKRLQSSFSHYFNYLQVFRGLI